VISNTLLLAHIRKYIRERYLLVGTDKITSGILGNVCARDSPHVCRELDRCLALIDESEKFVFDSGQDRDMQTVETVRETAINMMHADIFHLPHPVIWVEDPFDTRLGFKRCCYLCVERNSQIEIYSVRVDTADEMDSSLPADQLAITVALVPVVINLADPSDDYWIRGHKMTGGSVTNRDAKAAYIYSHLHHLGEAVYGVKKLIVTLAASNTLTEHHSGRPGKSNSGRRSRYDYTTIRVPIDNSDVESSGGGSTGKRRMSLVRGYVWGKNTRPIEEQRWVKPFWRGNAELGVINREGYKVAA
jgi:hypothetical protein